MFWSCVLVAIPIILLILAFCFWRLCNNGYDDLIELFAILTFVAGSAGILIVGATIPTSRISVNAKMQAFHSVETTAEVARKQEGNIENTAFILKIAEMNQWLASTKYYRKKFTFWYPKEIENLKPIK